MNDLREFFQSKDHRFIHKWDHYFDIYDRHFNHLRGKEIAILEIGIFEGGSLQMWKDYFGKKARIYGIDIDPRCKQYEEDQINVFIGSQSDKEFLKHVTKQIGPLDVIIDDGGHTMRQQIISFNELFDHLKIGGLYLAEDLHTSYWAKFGGGHKRRGTFIEHSKNLIDKLHAYHSEQKSLKIDWHSESIGCLHYYDSILLIDKVKRERPFELASGALPEQKEYVPDGSLGSLITREKIKLRRNLDHVIDVVTRFLNLPSRV